MRRTRIAALVFVVFLVASFPLITSVAAADEPDFEVYVPENIVEPGEETNLELEIRNAASPYEDDSDVGDAPPTEARDVTVALNETDAPVDVKTNETPMPTMSAQTLFSESFTIAVDEDAEAGTYQLEAEIEYAYDEDDSSTDTETVEIVVEERARFDAGNVTSNLVVGDRGTVTLELENTGVENASNAVVQFDSPDPNVQTIDPTTDESELQTAGSEEYVGDWEINETTTVKAAMDVDSDAVARTYPVSVTVDFRDEDGVDRTSREVRVGADTAPEQQFVAEDLTTDLYVGEDGTVEGKIVNDGPMPVENAVIVVDDGEDGIVPELEGGLGSGSNVYPRETQYAVGDLKPGDSEPFEFRVGIGGGAEPGPRIMEADVRYRNIHDDVRMTHDPIDVPLEVAPERDEFDVEILNATQEVGDTQKISLEVTNAKAETVTDIEAELYTNDPLDSDGGGGFIPALDPGESATVTFEVEVEGDATPQTYPLRMDFRYDDERSNSQLTDTYRIPLEVVEPDRRLSPLGIAIIVGTFGILAAASWRFRDEIEDAADGVPVLERTSEVHPFAPIARRIDERRSDTRSTTGTDTGYGGHAPVDSSIDPDSSLSDGRIDDVMDETEMGQSAEDEQFEFGEGSEVDETGKADDFDERQWDRSDRHSGDQEHHEPDHDDRADSDTDP